MSRENIEIVRGLAEAFQRRDHERAFEFYDEEIEWDGTGMSEVYPDAAGVWHGHEGVRTFWRRWLSAWTDLQFEIQDVLNAGDDVVLLIHNQEQWGRHTGIKTEFPPYAMVFTIRGGKVVRWRIFADQESALMAAGLPDQLSKLHSGGPGRSRSSSDR
jgi:ketosteroid isomerase-like protein